MRTLKEKILAAIGVVLLTSFATVAICEACVTFITQDTYVVDESGSVSY